MRVEEEKAARTKQDRARRMLQDVEVANNLSMTMKATKKQKE